MPLAKKNAACGRGRERAFIALSPLEYNAISLRSVGWVGGLEKKAGQRTAVLGLLGRASCEHPLGKAKKRVFLIT